MTKAGYIDEAVVEKLLSSFGSKVKECVPTDSEIMTAAGRVLVLGLQTHLTDGDPSATTPEIQAKLEMFGDSLRKLIEAAINETQPAAQASAVTLDELDCEPISEDEKQFIKELLRQCPSASLWRVDGKLKFRGIRLKKPGE
jgi:hypothetical protein